MSSPNNALLPPNAQAQLDRAKSLVSGLSRPTKVLASSFVVIALLIGGYFSTRTMFEPYTTLFTSLERDDTAQIVSKLKELKIPYRLGADGTTVEVPEARAHELRLDLASAGLPRGGNVGFESFDKMRLGATDFEQRVLFRRSLEGELSRTIGSLAAVQSARVHLVMPEKSVFVSKSEPATASIVLRLRGGRTLGQSEVAAIVHLTSTSVPGLSPDRVTVVSTEGTVLHRPRRSGAESGAELDENGQTPARALESSLEERTRAMLERVVGVGKADVRISAEMDMARVERVEDHYDPSKTALRSEERSIERAAGSSETLAGVPGAESALPSGSATPASPTSPPGTVRESHTRNFEVDHVLEKRIATTGALKRLTVAVVLDGVTRMENGQPVTALRTAEELEMLTKLVRNAVGADDKRGDLIAVQSVNFVDVSAAAAPEVPAATSLLAKFDLKKHGKYVAIAGGALLALMFIGFILRRRAAARRPLEPIMLGALQEAGIAALAAPQPTAAALARAVEASVDSRDEATERALRDPASAALVLRAWLGVADEKDPKAAA